MTTLRLVAAVVILLGAGACARANDDETLMRAAALLRTIANDVDAFVSSSPEASTLPEAEIIQRATIRDPSRLVELGDYVLRVKVEGRNSAVLMCSSDRTRGLVEDAGCSGRVDKLYFREGPGQSCVFTLNLAEVCR